MALRETYVRCKWPGQPFVAFLTCSMCGDPNGVALEQMRGAIAHFAATTGFIAHGRAIEIKSCCAACCTAMVGEAPPELFNPEPDTSFG